MTTSIALVYYANPDHYSVNQANREWLIKEGYEKLIKSASVPINVGFLGSTLKQISDHNSSHLARLNTLKSVKYFFTSYSHFFTHKFGKDTTLQITYGKKFISTFLNKSKLMNVFAFPEYDLPKNWSLHNDKENMFDYFLCHNSVLNHSSLAKCALSYNVASKKHKVLCIHKNLLYREVLHKYLREECSPQEVISAIKTDFHNLGNQSLLICTIDLEVAVLNRVHIKPNFLSPPRFDLFDNLFQAFAKSSLVFVHLDSPLIRSIASKKHTTKLSPVHVSVKRDNHYKKVYQFLKNKREILLELMPLKYLECTTSDYFTHNQHSLVFPALYKKRKGQVTIKRSGLKKVILDNKLKQLKKGLEKRK
jgi:hypothetical protein